MTSAPEEFCWVDGRITARSKAAVRADDCAFTDGRGCYTSVRIRDGRPRFADRHLRRLQDGAAALRLGRVEKLDFEKALADLAATFADGEGIVRLQVSCDADGGVHLTGLPRGLGDEPPAWHAVTSTLRHAGEVLPGGYKLTNRVVLALAARQADEAGADEALLFDADDRLVEGSRSNILVVAADGVPCAPPEASGAVGGIALQVASERLPELRRRPIERAALAAAKEIVALNAARGARPITRLDDRPVADGQPGPWAARLRGVFETR